MDESLRVYDSRLIACRVRSASTADPLARAAYAAMADEFISNVNDDAGMVDDDGRSDPAAPPPTDAPSQTPRPDVARPRLLVIDDQPEITVLIQCIAESQGYEVRVVNNSTKAFAAFQGFVPEILIMDLVMPNVDGIELLQMIRNSGHIPRILVMSGYGEFYLRMADTLASGTGLPSVTTMSKPIRRSDLVGFLAASATP